MNSPQIYSPVQLANYLKPLRQQTTGPRMRWPGGSALSRPHCPILKITLTKTTLTTLFKILQSLGGGDDAERQSHRETAPAPDNNTDLDW